MNLLTIETSSLMSRLKEFEEKNEAVAIYRHDERHRLQQLSAMLMEGRVNEAVDFLGQTDVALSETAIRHFYSDPTINAVLSFYAEAAERESIPFFFRGDTPEQGSEGAEMFPLVIANALENALRANQKIRDKANRFIRIVLINKPQRMLRVENPLPEGTVFDKEGFPISGGQGGDRKHGIGVKSIRAFAKKHDAALYYQVETQDEPHTLVMTMIG